MTCQIGDGMLAAISAEGNLQLLGKPEMGEHGGQTEFLTSKKVLEKGNLLQKTSLFPGNLKALMVMTDGVSDDYFPHNPGMLELYGDLILNQIIPISNVDETEIKTQLSNTPLGSMEGLAEVRVNFEEEIARILPENTKEPQKVCIKSFANYVQELNKSITEVLSSPPLLAAGISLGGMCQQVSQMSPETKLQLWLDSYYRRGSFDDRTLVVMYR